MPTTPAQAAAKWEEYIDELNASRALLRQWHFGTVDGGPNGDGYYPYPDGTGMVYLAACPAKLESLAGAVSFEEASVTDLPTMDQTDKAAGAPLVPAVSAKDGALKKFPIDLFVSRKTVDRDILQGSEYAEWIDCLSSTGQERKIAVEYLSRSYGDIIDPSRPPYNVKYDAQKTKPVSITAGSNRVVSSENVFVSSDVGKIAAVSNGDSSLGPLVGYIGVVESANVVRLFTDLSFTTPSNANQNRSGEEMIWGTDSTVGMQAAFDAAEPAGLRNAGRVVGIGGMALVTRLRFGSISIVGLSGTGCGFIAFPIPNNSSAFIADKTTGRYGSGQYKPDNYTVKDIVILAQQFTEYFSSFRRGFQINGGGFNAFLRGAPYARIDNLEVREARWEGITTNGAFAGSMNRIKVFNCAQTGMRNGFWDLNGNDWHAESNGGAGILSTMTGANVSGLRLSYNGSQGGRIFLAGAFHPHELGANYTECGYGNAITNIRAQECWGHNLCFSGSDPLQIYPGGGGKNTFTLATLDDTANLGPAKGVPPTSRYPAQRAMIMMKGNTVTNNVIRLATGAGHVWQQNFATNGYYDQGNPSNNIVELVTPGITNDPADWFQGTSTYPSANPGPFATGSDSSIGTRGNVVSVNGVLAP